MKHLSNFSKKIINDLISSGERMLIFNLKKNLNKFKKKLVKFFIIKFYYYFYK